ncbi:hypothetical protein [Glycomyces salinus]|uniref:hypothetical protein n=1 Tax=Glycomyces salinus TaxID=980294 RepID=UPI0018EA8D73|nr:hypothetical protein [Glycomyces salinus]
MTQAPEDLPQEPKARLSDPPAAGSAARVPEQRAASERVAVAPGPMARPPVEMAPPPQQPPMWAPYPPYQPRPEKPRSHFGTILLVLVLVSSAVLAGGLVNGWRPGVPAAETGTITGAAVQPDEGSLPSPGPDAPEHEVLAYLREQAGLVLDAQGESLVNGSLEGWLAAFDPALHEEMTGRYDTLTAMGVSRFDYRIVTGPLEDASGAVPVYEITVSATICFVDPADECSPADVVFETSWEAGDDGLVMVGVEPSGGYAGPHPWEVQNMVAAVGDRTVVAAPEGMERQLDDALEIAEDAAINADKWALWERPDRYVVYIAGDDEFEDWFGGMFDGGDVLGFALPLEGTVDEERVPTTYATVMNVDRTGWGNELDSVIRHELGHAVTLWAAPSESYGNDTWWMVEGIAEYIDHGDRPLEDYARMWDIDEYIDQGGCADEIVGPTQEDDTLAGSGKYGCAFLGVHYMIDTYGQDAFADWFGRTAREGEPATSTAEEIFGKGYDELMGEITDFIAETA